MILNTLSVSDLNYLCGMKKPQNWKDIAGKKYGMITATDSYKRENGREMWLFSCDCGNQKYIRKDHVTGGNQKSCGCLVGGLIDLKGKRFGRLKVIKRAENISFDRVAWLCQCDCGETTVCSGGGLIDGSSSSCGCYRKDQALKAITTHGQSKTYLHKLWTNMKSRCYNTEATGYVLYGGRGIKIHQEWRNDFIAFRDYVIKNLGERPRDYSLDRIDNDGNYEPRNIRWANAKTQANNKRKRTVL